MSSTFDQGGFDNMVNKIMKDKEAQLQRLADRLGRQYKEQPVATVKPIIKREWARETEGDLTDPHLTEYATAISEGRRVKFRYTGIQR